MAERKTLGTISVITDSETSYDNIGDVDGGFNEYELRNHIEKYGVDGICQKLTAMNWQVWNMLRKINSDRDQAQSNTEIKQP